MHLVTTLKYSELGTLIHDGKVSLNNDELFFGETSAEISTYLQSRLGAPGYVLGICGRLNSKSVNLFRQLDREIQHERVILEMEIADNEALTMSAVELKETADIIEYGLPDEYLVEQLDAVLKVGKQSNSTGIQLVCTPYITRDANIRITSLSDNIELEVSDIKVIRKEKFNVTD